MYTMGIDVGTTGTRAIIVGSGGEVVAAATAGHQPMRMAMPGWAEQDPDDWWRAAILAVRTVLGQAPVQGAEIRAVGLSGQMHGVTLLDRADTPVRLAIIWCDQRSQAQCDAITARVGAKRLIELVLNPAITGFSAPKLLWIREHEPGVYERAAHVLLPKDFVRFKLTGEFATDVSDASGTLLFDVARRQWSDEVLQALEIDGSLLPRAFESPEVTGRISNEAALLTGLRSGTPVVAGAGDQAASAVGNGIVSQGLISATLGTSGVVFAFTGEAKLDPEGRIHTFCHAVPGKWHVMGVTQGAGLSLRWFREQLAESESWYARQAGEDPYELIVREAAKVSPGSDGLIFLPYLMGERTPHLDPEARGTWFGLTAAHTRAHLIRAILEGVAFSLRDSLEIFEALGIHVRQIRASGGGSRSVLWRNIQANIFRRDLVTLGESEGSAFGAALLAGVGAGIYRSVEEAVSDCVKVQDSISPDQETADRYDKYYRVYRDLYPALRTLAHELARLDREGS
ncbi:MAG: xylulokinase [Terriglobia bacterium]